MRAAESSLIVAVLFGACGTNPAAAQFRDSVTVTLGAHYDAGTVHRFFFGTRYRRLWTTPLRVPVLDLATFAGGLTPTERGGGLQTRSLRLRAADNREFTFRSVDKDPAAVLPADLRDTFAEDILQDQISSQHPLGALVVPPILDAVGVLHANPILVRMPDDARLGEFADFAGMVGLLEERPDDDEGAEFASAVDVVSTEDMLDALEANPHGRVDAREFLAARLVDLFLGDWDRHQDQWRWARFSETDTTSWHPIPRDRDQAFVRFDGLLLALLRRRVPQLQNFGPEYGGIEGATWNGRDVDRHILPDLEWPAWDSVARALRERLTDDVIDDAVARLPAVMLAIDGERLALNLKQRRDAIPDIARRYYEHLAGEVDIRASDRREVGRIVREPGGIVQIQVAERTDGGEGEPWYTRRFLPGETHDVRVHLRGDDDLAIVTGDGRGGATIRIIGGGGDDVMVDTSRVRGTRFYDDRGDNMVRGGSLDTREYTAIIDPAPNALPHRDWGGRTVMWLIPSATPDAGLTLGLTGTRTNYAFRKQPYASALSFQVVGSAGASSGRVALEGTFYRENSRQHVSIEALLSGIEVLRFHGFGNESADTLGVEHYRVIQTQARLTLLGGIAIAPATTLALGPTFLYARTPVDEGRNADRFIAAERPYGVGDVSQLGALLRLVHDGRDVPANATRGFYLEAGGSVYPRMLGLDAAIGRVHAEARTYLHASIPTHPVLALRAGGSHVFGDYPFYEAAFLGGRPGARGYRTDRFTADASASASAELRLELTRLRLLIPGTQGVFGFAEAGRVFLEGEDSDEWHTGLGGGLWFSALGRGNVLQVSAAAGDEGTRLYAGIGFPF